MLVAIAVAAVAAAHWPALSAQAISFDDHQYLLENYLVRNPSRAAARRFFGEVLEPSTVGGYYQPLTMISLMLDCAAGGRPDGLRPFHRTSLALHVANTALVIVLLYRLLTPSGVGRIPCRAGILPASGRRREAGATTREKALQGTALAAAAAGLLFGLHPLTVEPVAWVAERKTLLDAFFALVCLILYTGYVRREKRRWPLYAGCLGAYALALLSKPTSTLLPVLLLLLDSWPLRRLGRRAVIEKIPFFAVGAVSAAITIISQGRTAVVDLPGEHSPWRIPLILCHNIVFYLGKILWPANLTWYYPFPSPLDLSDRMVLAGVMGTCVLIPLLLLSLRRTRVAVIGSLFFFIAILPAMGIIGFTPVIAADRFVYFPLVGLLLILAAVLSCAWNEAFGTGGRPGVLPIAAAVGVMLAAVGEAAVTRHCYTFWRDSESLYRRMVGGAPGAAAAHAGLGLALFGQGKVAEAVASYREAIRLRPDYAQAHNDLGSVYVQQGKPAEAERHFREALRIRPAFPQAHGNLGKVLADRGAFAEAMRHLEEALQLRPESPTAHFNMGVALTKQGQAERAIPHFREALRLRPDMPDAHAKIANALLQQGKMDEAILEYREALRRQPNDPGVRSNLGVALLNRRRTDEAILEFRESLRLDPSSADTRCNLGAALAAQGRTDEAIAEIREAVRRRPDDANLHTTLGTLLGFRGQRDEAVRHYQEALRIDPNHAEARERLKAAGR